MWLLLGQLLEKSGLLLFQHLATMISKQIFWVVVGLQPKEKALGSTWVVDVVSIIISAWQNE